MAKRAEIGAIPTGKGPTDYPARPQLPSWEEFGLVEIPDLARKVATLNREKRHIQDQLDELNVQILAEMAGVDDSKSWSVKDPDEQWTVTFMSPEPRKTLVPEKLVALGVSLAIIKKATKETKIAPYVVVRTPKGGDE